MKRLLILLAVVICASTACDATSAPWAAKVDGKAITSKSLERDLKLVSANSTVAQQLDENLQSTGGLKSGGPNTINSSYTARALYQRILGMEFQNEVNRLGLHATQADTDKANKEASTSQGGDAAFNALPSDYRNFLVSYQLNLDLLTAYRANETNQRAYYQAHLDDYNVTCISYIVVSNSQQANDIAKQLAGGADFAKTANEQSLASPTQQGGKPDDGVLGCLNAKQLSSIPSDITSAVAALQPGQVSKPLYVQNSYYLMKVTDRRLQSFDEAKTAIAQTYGDQTQLVQELLSKSKIKVNPRFGTYIPASVSGSQIDSVGQTTPYALTPDPDKSAANDNSDASSLLGGLQ